MSEKMPMDLSVNSKEFKKVEDVNSEPELGDVAHKHPDFDLIAEKLLISRATTTEQFKSPNVYRAAENLYAALYDPMAVDELIVPNEKYPNRMQTLKKSLSAIPAVIPTKEEFIAKVRYAMVNEADFGKCLNADARVQFRQVMEKSEHTVIWTDGDAEGVPEHGLPGSKEQLKKLAAAQFYNKVRREIAQERDVKHTDVLSIVAIEGKMKFIPAIVERFIEREIQRIIIVEDRVKNLIQALELIKKTSPGMEVFPVWIREGIWKNKIEEGKSLDEWAEELHAITEISQLMTLLEKNNVFDGNVKVGSIFDLDGPLHNDDVRKKLQTEAVVKALEKNGWI